MSETEHTEDGNGQDGGASDETPMRLTPVEAIRAEQSQQLIRYLQKTAHVPGPGRDLIHLESPGAVYGLDPGFADTLEDDAVNGRTSDVVTAIEKLDPTDQVAAYRLLARRIREASIGVETTNAMTTLMQALRHCNEPLEPAVANELAGAVAEHEVRYSLRRDDLQGALLLGLWSDRGTGSRLRQSVLEREELETDAELGSATLQSAGALMPEFTDRLGAIAASLLISDSERASRTLLSLDDGVATSIVEAMAPRVSSETAELTRRAAGTEDSADATEAKADLDRYITAIASLVGSLLSEHRKALGEAFAYLLLAINHQDARHQFGTHAEALQPIASPELTGALIARVERRAAEEWPTWLGAVDPKVVVRSDESTRVDAQQLARKLWEGGTQRPDQNSLEHVESAAEHLRPIREALREWDTSSLEDEIADQVAATPLDQGGAAEHDRILVLARTLIDAGLIGAVPIADATVTAVSSLVSATPVAENIPALADHVSKWGVWAVQSASPNQAQVLADATRDTSWLPTPHRELIGLSSAAALVDGGREIDSPYAAETLRDITDQSEDSFAPGLRLWLSRFKPPPSEAWTALSPVVGREIDGELRSALENYSDSLTEKQRFELSRPAVEGAFDRMPSASFLDSIRFSQLPETEVARLLVERYQRATSNEDRERILLLWELFRPVSDPARRSLIQDALLPLARLNKQGLDIALKHLNLAIPTPHGTKKQLVDTLRDAARDDEQKRRTERRLLDAGLLRKTGIRRRLTVSNGDE
jgi:hypothetical protein